MNELESREPLLFEAKRFTKTVANIVDIVQGKATNGQVQKWEAVGFKIPRNGCAGESKPSYSRRSTLGEGAGRKSHRRDLSPPPSQPPHCCLMISGDPTRFPICSTMRCYHFAMRLVVPIATALRHESYHHCCSACTILPCGSYLG